MDKEVEEKCLAKRTVTIEPSASRISKKEIRNSLAAQHKNNSEYFLECAKNISKSSTPLAAVLIAHFAMEHKANQLLAQLGYKVESHVCTQIFLSRIAGRKDLAKNLSDIFTSRQSIGYRMNLKMSEENKKEAEKILNETVIPFFEEIEKLLKETE
ncbi:MAG: hypothetical protein AABX51_03040 [Nanoarchaeota archaeon]